MSEALDFVLVTRLREVLRADGTATESDLRALAEQGEAWGRTLQAQIEASERRLDELSGTSDAPLPELAGELRRVESLRPQLAELRELLAGLEARARQLRAEWLARQTGLM